MVRRLIALGLAGRRRAPRDRRTFLVSLTSLTREGLRRMRRAFLILFKLFKRKPFQRRFERAFGERSWTTRHAVRNLAFAAERVARHLRDTSWPAYEGSCLCVHDHDGDAALTPPAAR